MISIYLLLDCKKAYFERRKRCFCTCKSRPCVCSDELLYFCSSTFADVHKGPPSAVDVPNRYYEYLFLHDYLI